MEPRFPVLETPYSHILGMGHYANNRSKLRDHRGIQELSLAEVRMHRAGAGAHGYSRNTGIGYRPLFCALWTHYMLY